MKQRLAAILAADAAGYSRLMGTDERETVASLDAARAVFRTEIESRLGRVIDMAGDSVLAVFESATGAVEAALAVQKALASQAGALPAQRRMQFRIGVHLGDVIEKADGTVYGDGVNIAARLQALAEPGGIAVSQAVEGVVRGKVAARFDDRGEHAAKNIANPLRAYFAHAGDRSPPAPAAAGAPPSLPDRPSIAVLPFTNMSGDAEQEYFADGMAEDIITALSRFHELFVIARNSSFVYKGRAVDIQQVARELGVRYVLEGSVRKAGSRVRITGQLIDAASRTHLWADRFDGPLDDVFDLQDRVTERVVGALQPTLREAEIERARRKHPASLDAYDYLLRALPLVIANALAEAGSAITLLSEALRLNPDYAYAHALISMAYAQIFRSAAGPERDEARTKALAHARRALETAGDDSNAFAYAGFIILLTDQDRRRRARRPGPRGGAESELGQRVRLPCPCPLDGRGGGRGDRECGPRAALESARRHQLPAADGARHRAYLAAPFRRGRRLGAQGNTVGAAALSDELCLARCRGMQSREYGRGRAADQAPGRDPAELHARHAAEPVRHLPACAAHERAGGDARRRGAAEIS